MRAIAVPMVVAILWATAPDARAQELAPPPRSRAPAPGQFPTAADADAWAGLPPRKNPPLPAWARTLAGPLPKTTARMLELDHLHRAENPLGSVLAGKIRWVVADALGSEYGVAAANADLARAGFALPGGKYAGPPADGPKDEAAALAFARTLTRAGYTITDEEFAELLGFYGPERVTAIVHTVAYANFHNRIVLGIGARDDGTPDRVPLPPIPMTFDASAPAGVGAPARPVWGDLKAATGDGPTVRVEWARTGLDLARTLDAQKARKLRVPLPDPARFEHLPPRERDQAGKILWNTVSSGYQPGMTRAWFACLGAYYEEAKVDRVVTNSMFWVVTRTNDCFY